MADNYNNYVFALVRPPFRIISTHQITNEIEYAGLLEQAEQNKSLLYYAELIIVNDKKDIKQPWLIDWRSFKQFEKQPPKEVVMVFAGDSAKEPEPVIEPEPITELIKELRCPFCKKKIASTAGRTLHVKSKHPDQFEEYQKSLP